MNVMKAAVATTVLTALAASATAFAQAAPGFPQQTGMGMPFTVPLSWLALGVVLGWIIAGLTKANVSACAGAGVLGALVGGFVGLQFIPPQEPGQYSWASTIGYAAIGALLVALLVAISRKTS